MPDAMLTKVLRLDLLRLSLRHLLPRPCFPSPHLPNLYCTQSASPLAAQTSSDKPSTQKGHSKCALLTLPQAEHLFKAVTSLNALPARNLWRFFLCEVFFFGTARIIDSHISASIAGTKDRVARGMNMAPLEMVRVTWFR